MADRVGYDLRIRAPGRCGSGGAMSGVKPVIIPQGDRYSHLDEVIERHKLDIISELREPDDGDSPFMDFWALIRGAAEMDVRQAKNTAYYAAGYCGGCDTCGLPPYPGVSYDMADQVRVKFVSVLAQMDRWDMRIKAQSKLERKKATIGVKSDGVDAGF